VVSAQQLKPAHFGEVFAVLAEPPECHAEAFAGQLRLGRFANFLPLCLVFALKAHRCAD
jgi:hypothetical protein